MYVTMYDVWITYLVIYLLVPGQENALILLQLLHE